MRTDHPTWAEQLARPVNTLLQQPWVENIARPGTVDDVLRGVHPMLSLTQVRARVLRVIDETPDTRTLVLQPNALWRGAQAGQFVQVRAEIDGRRVERAYSVSSRPGARRIAITVKRQPGGLMSQHLHDHARRGSVLTISQAMGEFQLPAVLPPRILLLSAGSGITPVMAMLHDLRQRRYSGDVQFVHVCRSAEDLIFAQTLQAIAAQHPTLRLHLHFSATMGRFDSATLQRLVPDLATRATWLCGPAALMDAVHELWQREAFDAPLCSERFAAAPLQPAVALGMPVSVDFATSGKRFTTHGAGPLLEQAERVGLAPRHGCRIGICRSCQCVKRSGTVQNLQTGELSSAPNELIRLCISAARSDVALDL